MKLFSWVNIRLILILGVVIFLFTFSSVKNSERKIAKINIVFVGQSPLFLNEETVNKLLIEKNSNFKSVNKDDLDLNRLEKTFCEQEMIQKASVSLGVDGVLNVEVTQKTPFARVVNEKGSFYIDSEGGKMPLSGLYSARVPLIFGEIGAINSERLSSVLKKIYEDDFLKKNIIGIEISSKGDMVMRNRNYGFLIDFGKPYRIERKFSNYKAFFQKEVLDSTLNKYRRINLKFENQVVCIK